MLDSFEWEVLGSEGRLSRKLQKLLLFLCSLLLGGGIWDLLPHAPAFSIFAPFEGPEIAFEVPHAPASSILTPFEGPDITFDACVCARGADCTDELVGEGESEGRCSGMTLTTGA